MNNYSQGGATSWGESPTKWEQQPLRRDILLNLAALLHVQLSIAGNFSGQIIGSWLLLKCHCTFVQPFLLLMMTIFFKMVLSASSIGVSCYLAYILHFVLKVYMISLVFGLLYFWSFRTSALSVSRPMQSMCFSSSLGAPSLKKIMWLYNRVDRRRWTCGKNNNTTPVNSLRGSQKRLQYFFLFKHVVSYSHGHLWISHQGGSIYLSLFRLSE